MYDAKCVRTAGPAKAALRSLNSRPFLQMKWTQMKSQVCHSVLTTLPTPSEIQQQNWQLLWHPGTRKLTGLSKPQGDGPLVFPLH